ncbi:MAG: hypothetical protein KME43_17880 [Myxacorys chilensis ATA2-1-KO14]|jgi:hypothetical protein|nr:hypothetical protein [Myxacorys chilensis ATA2-1-KO14]
MTTRSLQPTGLLSKLSEFLQTHFSGASTPLRDKPNQGNHSSTQRTQALRDLQQTYYLERRGFL